MQLTYRLQDFVHVFRGSQIPATIHLVRVRHRHLHQSIGRLNATMTVDRSQQFVYES